jgi:hypothetical protein
MSMEHHKALATKASERYLLGEMSEDERFEFEAHYFDCVACADDVRTGAALARGIKAVCAEDAALRPQTTVVRDPPGPGWFSWLSFPVLAPSVLALAFACVAAWQYFVVMPGLRWAGGTQALTPIVLRAAARGEEQALELRKDQPVSMLSLDVNAAAPGAPLRYDVDGPGGGTRLSGTTQAPPAASPLIVMLPNAAIRESGAWVLILRTPQGAELARYPFSVHSN